jgi:hypothetical protein
MPLQYQTQGGVKKLLIHNSATNPQAPDPSLQGECCCLGYVRLTQCIDTGFDCGLCPTSGSDPGCDEDGDGSDDYPHIVYIDEGIWEEKAKSFAPSDCVGGGSWSSVSKSGVVVVSTIACHGYQTAGTVSTLPASCQDNIRSIDFLAEFQGNQTPPGIPANPGGTAAKNLITYANCEAACEDYYYEANTCSDAACGQAFSEFQCPADSKKYYIPCAMLEAFFGAGQVDNNIGKVFKLNNSLTGPCVKLSSTKLCGVELPYACVSGTWTKGAVDGEARIAGSIEGSAVDDCCTCQGATCGCLRACKDDLASSYSISLTGVATDGQPYECACGSNNFYGSDCSAVGESGGNFSGTPHESCSQTGNTLCCQNQGVCGITSFPSVSVRHPAEDGNPSGGASCYAGEFTSDGFGATAGPGDTPTQRSGCVRFTNGTGQIGGSNPPCENLGTFMTSPVVAFKCRFCDSNNPCACPECGGNCDTSNCEPGGITGMPISCFEHDTGGDSSNDCRSCEAEYEDDFFVFAARLYCPNAVAGGSGGANDNKWTVEFSCVWPGQGQSLHGPLRENDNREFATNGILPNITITAVKDDSSEDPTGDYTLTSFPSSLPTHCIFSSFENFLSGTTIFDNAKITVS